MNQTITKEPIIKEPITDDTRFTITQKGRAALAAPAIPEQSETDEYAAQCLSDDCHNLYRTICKAVKNGATPAQVERAAIEAGENVKIAVMMKWAARHLIREASLQEAKGAK